MKSRRGLTLIEILASVTLLSMLAAACVPLLRDAMAALESPRQAIDPVELGAVADALAREPSRFGFKDSAELLEQASSVQLSWSVDEAKQKQAELPLPSELPPVTVRCLVSDEEDVHHAWLIVESEGIAISRWIKVPEELRPKDSP